MWCSDNVKMYPVAWKKQQQCLHLILEAMSGVYTVCENGFSEHRRHLNSFSYWYSGEQLLKVISSDGLAFGDEEAGFPDHSLEDKMQQLIAQSAKHRHLTLKAQLVCFIVI